MRAEALLAVCLAVLVPAGAHGAANIGTAEIVLPGFTALTWNEGRLALGAGRVYEWKQGLLPARIDARDRPLTGPLTLRLRQDGQARPLPPVTLSVTAATGHHVELAGSVAASDALTVSAVVRVEYDGLATVDLTLTPRGSVAIDGLDLHIPVLRTPDLRLQAYEPEGIFDFRKQVVFPLCGALPYKSVLGLGDTERSFWVLTDEPAFPGEVRDRPPTTLACDAREVRVVQPLLGAQLLTTPLTLRFAFLAAPVRELPASIRRDRVVPGLAPEEALYGNRQLWWVEALPHYALPYVDYPPGARERLTPADRAAYPGLRANRADLRAWRSLGIERLPYVSLRAPSALEAVPAAEGERWRVLPPMTFPAVGDGPYRQGFPRPVLSHRAPGFSDYLLGRLDGVLAELPVRGFYFDQAGPVGSANPLHLPVDPRVRPTQATDILAVREFYKRLATAIHERGREPLIYVHNSMETVLPAYTFVTAMVQGEEFTSTLKNLNYLASTNFETLQATFVSGQFGVPVIWLEEAWSDVLAGQRPARYREDQAAWLQSPQFEAAWRNFMAVALLHDVPVWTLAPAPLRYALYGALDRFGVDRSRFTGYWRLDPGWRTRSILVSVYTRDNGKRLAVIVNRSQAAREVSADDLAPFLGSDPKAARRALGRRIPPNDFALIAL